MVALKDLFNANITQYNGYLSLDTTEFDEKEKMSIIYDSHCHAVEGKFDDCSSEIKMVLMTTKREEWERVLLFKRHSKAFGIHPWFAHLHDWESDGRLLEELLLQNPLSIVGEIGVDKAAKDLGSGKLYPFDEQVYFCNRYD
jgi:Tat protein secretion system quality control protein TatD with DNase activity